MTAKWNNEVEMTEKYSREERCVHNNDTNNTSHYYYIEIIVGAKLMN